MVIGGIAEDSRTLQSGSYHATIEQGPLRRAVASAGNRKSGAHFGWGAGAPPEVPGGGTTFGSRALGAGFSMPGSTSFGWMTPFDWFSSLLRFWVGAVGSAPGVVLFGAGLGVWANAAPATRAAPATIMQSRESMIRMAFERMGVRPVPWVVAKRP